MKSRIVLFVVALIVWVGFIWPPDWSHIALGIPIAVFIAYMTGDMFVTRPHHLIHPTRYLWLMIYIPVFIWECFKANLDVVYRVIHPEVPIDPGIVKVKTKLKSDTGITFLANSITLTPGTLTVDVDQQNGYLYIHWIHVYKKDIEGATKNIVRRFEYILERIFE